jgi:hypothetical protein
MVGVPSGMPRLKKRISADMKLLASIVFAVAVLGLAPMARADDPSLHEVYQAIHSGHLNEAQSMMTRVLHDHPDSAKAHYMEAEVLVRMDRAEEAQIELDHADRLSPGLKFATAEAQSSLRGLIAERSHARSGSIERSASMASGTPAAPSIPWGPILIVGGVGLLVFLFLRARRQAALTGAPGAAGMGPVGTPYGAGPYGGAPYGGGPGIGSGIVGGLATGAALGAGMVAGEAIAHEFMGNRERGGTDLASGAGSRSAADDGGGNDFGVSGGDSWDSGSSDMGDSGGGGGDWG